MNPTVNIFKEDNGDTSIFLYQANVLSGEKYDQLKKWTGHINYKSGATKYGSQINRQQVWYQQDQKYFCPAWKQRHSRWESEKYDSLLQECQQEVQDTVNKICEEHPFMVKPIINSCLVNKYNDGNDFITPHRDSKISFGEQPTIVGLSLGGTRTLQFNRVVVNDVPTSKKHSVIKTFEQPLQDNSLFVMGGYSQKYFTHQIPKDDSTDVRYSLTFREMVV
jgi:alkylated DNA repair dioxygenase AlkB